MMQWAQIQSKLSLTKLFGPHPIARWLRGAGWLFGSSTIERVAALLQTVLIARSIGIEDYGRYALLLSTVSLLSPIVSLQLPYSIISFVSRFATRAPERAGAILLLGQRLTIVTTMSVVALSLIAPPALSRWLFVDSSFGWAVVMGSILLATSILAGLNDALLQALEAFRTLALARLSSAIVALILIGGVAWRAPGLDHVMGAIAVAGVVRLIAVAIPARKLAKPLMAATNLRAARAEIPAIFHFALPSGLLSLTTGYSAWTGNFFLSRAPTGLHDLAIANTALQWRTPILVIMASLASALLPMLGRHLGEGNLAEARQMQRYNMALNIGLATLFCAIVILASDWVLALYGREFGGRNYLFALFLLPLIPTVYCTVQQQFLVAAGMMWTQLFASLPQAIIVIGATFYFGAALDGEKLGYIQLTGWIATSALLGLITWRHQMRSGEETRGEGPPLTSTADTIA